MNHNILNMVAQKSCLEVQEKLSSILRHVNVPSKYTYLIEGKYRDNFGPDGDDYHAFHITNDASKTGDIIGEYLSKDKLTGSLIGSFLLIEQDNPNAYIHTNTRIYCIELNRLYKWEELEILEFFEDDLKTKSIPVKKGNYSNEALIRGVVFYHPQMPLIIEDLRKVIKYYGDCRSYKDENDIQWDTENEDLPIARPELSILNFNNCGFLNFHHHLDRLKEYINLSYSYLEPYPYGKIDGLKYYMFYTDSEENAEYIIKKNMLNNDKYLYDYTYIKFDKMMY